MNVRAEKVLEREGFLRTSMRIAFLSLIFISLFPFQLLAAGWKTVIHGRVLDAANGKALHNCNITLTPGDYGTTSNHTGRYRLRVPADVYTITFSYVGYKKWSQEVDLTKVSSAMKLNAYLEPERVEGEEVTFTQKPLSETLVQKIASADIRRMPTTYADVMRSIKILPGVSSNNELSSAYNVRGGNFDENLIYLNGYEIYRPYLLRQGVEENLSLANQEMVGNLKFHNGAFPAKYGDKMSSALEIDYKDPIEKGTGGEAKVNLIYSGFELHQRFDKFRWIGGLRYANPSLFVNQQHTEGEYKPEFYDGQFMARYDLTKTSQVELFMLSLHNKYTLEPEKWIGHHGSYFDPQQVTIKYDGAREYTTSNELIGLKYEKELSKTGLFDFSLARYSMQEQENVDFFSKYYDDGSAYFPSDRPDYLKSRKELADNHLELVTHELKSNIEVVRDKHTIQAGVRVRQVELDDRIDEEFTEEGTVNAEPNAPHYAQSRQSFDMNSYGAYAADEISFTPNWNANIGARYLYYEFTDEHLVSPRIKTNFRVNTLNTINFSFGYYYQPPFYYEARGKSLSEAKSLRSQLAVHYIAGWEHRLSPTLKLVTEVYYKHLNHLIPYYIENVKLEYGNGNNSEGYAKGFDILLKGEIIEGLNSWLGYSYLDTGERVKGTEHYKRRVLDQSHTLRFFLQDKMPRNPRLQAHLRLLFGSGYRYHPRMLITDDGSGLRQIVVDQSVTNKYSFYGRADAGFTYRLPLKNKFEIIFLGEVQNMFYHTNVANYSWVNVSTEEQFATRIANLFPGRFFNIGMEVIF